MAIVSMTKMKLMAMSYHKEKILNALHKTGCVELFEPEAAELQIDPLPVFFRNHRHRQPDDAAEQPAKRRDDRHRQIQRSLPERRAVVARRQRRGGEKERREGEPVVGNAVQ